MCLINKWFITNYPLATDLCIAEASTIVYRGSSRLCHGITIDTFAVL